MERVVSASILVEWMHARFNLWPAMANYNFTIFLTMLPWVDEICSQ